MEIVNCLKRLYEESCLELETEKILENFTENFEIFNYAIIEQCPAVKRLATFANSSNDSEALRSINILRLFVCPSTNNIKVSSDVLNNLSDRQKLRLTQLIILDYFESGAFLMPQQDDATAGFSSSSSTSSSYPSLIGFSTLLNLLPEEIRCNDAQLEDTLCNLVFSQKILLKLDQSRRELQLERLLIGKRMITVPVNAPCGAAGQSNQSINSILANRKSQTHCFTDLEAMKEALYDWQKDCQTLLNQFMETTEQSQSYSTILMQAEATSQKRQECEEKYEKIKKKSKISSSTSKSAKSANTTTSSSSSSVTTSAITTGMKLIENCGNGVGTANSQTRSREQFEHEFDRLIEEYLQKSLIESGY